MPTVSVSRVPATPLSPPQLCLVFALVLGGVGERLLWAGIGGPGFALWIALLGTAAVALAWRAALRWRTEVASWSMVAVAAAGAMTLRDDEFLFLTLWLVLLVSAAMVCMRAWGARPGDARIADLAWAGPMVAARALGGSFTLLSTARPSDGTPRTRWLPVARGLLLAIPLLVLFTALFSAADATFERFVSRIGDALVADVPRHAALAIGLAWVAGGLLSAVAAGSTTNPLHRLPLPRVGAEESLVVMALLAALFGGFVLLQLGYLFGGREVIESISGLTVAEHARRGFFEMLGAAALTLVVLMAGGTMVRDARYFRPLALLLVLCVLVMLASAAQRLALYIDAFGLTVDRVNALAVMAWLGVTLVIFAATVLRGAERRFPGNAVLAGIVAAFVLTLVNPAALVARVNVQRSVERAESLDLDYLVTLGADAVPVLMSRLEDIPDLAAVLAVDANAQAANTRPEACERIAPLLEVRIRRRDGENDWRTWNAARAAAERELAARAEALNRAAGVCGRAPLRIP